MKESRTNSKLGNFELLPGRNSGFDLSHALSPQELELFNLIPQDVLPGFQLIAKEVGIDQNEFLLFIGTQLPTKVITARFFS